MSRETLQLIAEYERTLDAGLRKIIALCGKMRDELPRQVGGRIASDSIPVYVLDRLLAPWARAFYDHVARTLFDVLRTMQSTDFSNGSVNFYFWPGYHSYFVDRRLFCRLDRPVDTLRGVGLWGNPAVGEPESYHDCCQASWYERATMPVHGEFYPGSPYRWFMGQNPRESDESLYPIGSITLSTHDFPPSSRLPEHPLRRLPWRHGSSRKWGEQVAEMLNSFVVRKPDWIYPDRIDRDKCPDFLESQELQLRPLRNLLLSLWMHSAFCSGLPEWWNDLLREVEQQGLDKLRARLTAGLVDPVASDWADRSTGRAQFTTWTTITLDPLVAARPVAVVGPLRKALPGRPERSEHARNAGWATFLASVPLDPAFVMIARRWIRSAYGTFRNAEISILVGDQESVVKSVLVASTLFHDLNKFVQESVGEIVRQAADLSGAAADYRQFVMHALQSLTGMIDAMCNAVPNPAKVREFRKRFIESLSINSADLKSVLTRAAWDSQQFLRRNARGRVTLEPPCRLEQVMSLPRGSETYVFCLLLTGEMIRNYVTHGPRDECATWSVETSKQRVKLQLSGPATSESRSQTFRLLHTLLQELGVGNASSTWDEKTHIAQWEVLVDLKQEEFSA